MIRVPRCPECGDCKVILAPILQTPKEDELATNLPVACSQCDWRGFWDQVQYAAQ